MLTKRRRALARRGGRGHRVHAPVGWLHRSQRRGGAFRQFVERHDGTFQRRPMRELTETIIADRQFDVLRAYRNAHARALIIRCTQWAPPEIDDDLEDLVAVRRGEVEVTPDRPSRARVGGRGPGGSPGTRLPRRVSRAPRLGRSLWSPGASTASCRAPPERLGRPTPCVTVTGPGSSDRGFVVPCPGHGAGPAPLYAVVAVAEPSPSWSR